MPERQPNHAAIDDLAQDDLVQLDTPVIDMQDIEHRASDETRVSIEGVEVKPTGGDPPIEMALADLEREIDDEDRKAREAIAELEQSYPKLTSS